MKCIYCNKPAGFFKLQHQECYEQIKPIFEEVSKVIGLFNSGEITSELAKDKLIKIAINEKLYSEYLKNCTNNNKDIWNTEIILYCENGLTISESKNRAKMIRTGYRYERKPVWNVNNLKLEDNVSFVFTNQSVYMLFSQTSMRYPYNKIVNIGYDKVNLYTYFDVKTTSPHPHRFYINTDNRTEDNRLADICSLLKCFTRLE